IEAAEGFADDLFHHVVGQHLCRIGQQLVDRGVAVCGEDRKECLQSARKACLRASVFARNLVLIANLKLVLKWYCNVGGSRQTRWIASASRGNRDQFRCSKSSHWRKSLR
ncbi:MAG TPA: hypothetical protein VIT23_05385, partial [Terrimicrobiaceae bacterium]